MAAWAVDREFVYIVELTLDALWLLWCALRFSLAILWGPFAHLGVPLVAFGTTLSSL